jgi:nucleoside-diphosphate kinase
VAVERTLILIKPDAIERGLAGEILARIERRGCTLRAGKLLRVSPELGERHYAEHREKPFFGELVDFITGGDVVVAQVAGRDAVPVVRMMMGSTDPAASAPGTIRGDLALTVTDNLIHGSDSPESAERELALFFG